MLRTQEGRLAHGISIGSQRPVRGECVSDERQRARRTTKAVRNSLGAVGAIVLGPDARTGSRVQLMRGIYLSGYVLALRRRNHRGLRYKGSLNLAHDIT